MRCLIVSVATQKLSLLICFLVSCCAPASTLWRVVYRMCRSHTILAELRVKTWLKLDSTYILLCNLGAFVWVVATFALKHRIQVGEAVDRGGDGDFELAVHDKVHVHWFPFAYIDRSCSASSHYGCGSTSFVVTTYCGKTLNMRSRGAPCYWCGRVA